jgi:hypothetical protein
MLNIGQYVKSSSILSSSQIAPIISNGLYYETTTTAISSTITNIYQLDYSKGGIYIIDVIPTGLLNIKVTNIPVDSSKSYTFSVIYYQASTRYFGSLVQIQDAGNNYITNSGVSGYVAPLFLGGTPTPTGTTNCLMIQQFTIITVYGTTRRVLSSLSVFS